MKEVTVIYTIQVTDVFSYASELLISALKSAPKSENEKAIKGSLSADNVTILDKQIFVRDLE